MFHFLSKNLNLQLALFVLLAIWSAWIVFVQMTIMPAEGTMMLFQYVAKVWAWNSYVVRVCVLVMLLATAAALIQFSHRHHFFENRSYLPGVFLLFLLNCGKFLTVLSPALLTVFFIAVTLLVYSPNEQASKMKDRLFILGLFIAVATMLDISAFGIVLFLVMMIAINNVTSFKDILILLIGIAIPYIYAFSIAFISNGLPAFLQSWRDVDVFVPVRRFTGMRVIEYVALAYFVVVTVMLMLRDKSLLDSKLIVIRQAFNNVNLLWISMLLFLLLGVVPLPAALVYLTQPVALYMSVAVSQKRYHFVFDFLIVSLCVLLCL